MLYQCSAVICDVLAPEQSDFLHHRLTARPLTLPFFPLSRLSRALSPTRAVAGSDGGRLGGRCVLLFALVHYRAPITHYVTGPLFGS